METLNQRKEWVGKFYLYNNEFTKGEEASGKLIFDPVEGIYLFLEDGFTFGTSVTRTAEDENGNIITDPLQGRHKTQIDFSGPKDITIYGKCGEETLSLFNCNSTNNGFSVYADGDTLSKTGQQIYSVEYFTLYKGYPGFILKNIESISGINLEIDGLSQFVKRDAFTATPERSIQQKKINKNREKYYTCDLGDTKYSVIDNYEQHEVSSGYIYKHLPLFKIEFGNRKNIRDAINTSSKLTHLVSLIHRSHKQINSFKLLIQKEYFKHNPLTLLSIEKISLLEDLYEFELYFKQKIYPVLPRNKNSTLFSLSDNLNLKDIISGYSNCSEKLETQIKILLASFSQQNEPEMLLMSLMPALEGIYSILYEDTEKGHLPKVEYKKISTQAKKVIRSNKSNIISATDLPQGNYEEYFKHITSNISNNYRYFRQKLEDIISRDNASISPDIFDVVRADNSWAENAVKYRNGYAHNGYIIENDDAPLSDIVTVAQNLLLVIILSEIFVNKDILLKICKNYIS